MPYRLIDVYLPANARESVKQSVEESTAWKTLGVWSTDLGDERSIVKILVDVEETELITDRLCSLFNHDEEFRIIVMPVEASVPLPPEPVKEEPEPDEHVVVLDAALEETDGAEAPDKKGAEKSGVGRVSRDEIYSEMLDAVKLSPVYFVLVVLSTVVASIGLAKDNTAVIIGAMVIAPLLGPTIALALASMLGDAALGKKALRTGALGIGLAYGLAVLFGVIFPINPAGQEIAMRTQVGTVDIILALAAGGAGAISLSAAVPSAVIGVMVAVALLPPLAVSGMLLGAGYYQQALGAFLLLGSNLISVHLAAIIAFLVQGIRPSKWWEAAKARRASMRALAGSLLALGVLVLLIILSRA